LKLRQRKASDKPLILFKSSMAVHGCHAKSARLSPFLQLRNGGETRIQRAEKWVGT
jgi:hypothetical protein